MRILGIDPGLARVGYGMIDVEAGGQQSANGRRYENKSELQNLSNS